MDVCAQFKDDLGGKVVKDFNRLQLIGILDEYFAGFKELQSLLLVRNPNMSEAYILEASFEGQSLPSSHW